MSKEYWEEEPIIVDTGRNILRLFKTAQLLQVSRPNWIGRKGEVFAGLTVTLDVKALLECPDAVEMFRGLMR
jgi:hypothetical protein